MAIITTDNAFASIQKRSIDPYSNVYSDITSRFTKILGTDNAYISGFDLIGYDSDQDNNCITVTLSQGIGVISNIVVEITDRSTINLVSYPIQSLSSYYVVLEYIYQKITPVPIATIKSIPITEYNQNIHLPLWKFRVQGYDTWVSNSTLKLWFNSSEDYIIDERNKTGYIPRVGGKIFGTITLSEEPSSYNDNDLVSKKWVESLIKKMVGSLTEISPDGSGGGILSNYVQKTGATMTGPLLQTKNPLAPIYDYELITKAYVYNNYLPRSGGSLSGNITLPGDPQKPLDAASKNYVDNKLDGIEGSIINRLNTTFSHKNLQDLTSSDDHPQYILVSGTRAFTGPISYDGVQITKPTHLVPKAYVDNIKDELQNSISNVEAFVTSGEGGSGGTTGGILGLITNHLDPLSDDHPNYIKTDGSRMFNGVILGITPSETSSEHLRALTTREYVDNKISSITPETIGIIKHSLLSERDRDDAHPQYALKSGTEFTGPITVPDVSDSEPNKNQYVATRGWIINYIEDKLSASITSLPAGVAYVKTDGSGIQIGIKKYTFNAEVTTTTPATKDEGLVTLGQVKGLMSVVDHDLLSNRDKDDAHPQYLLKTGGTLTGNLILPKEIIETDTDYNELSAVPYKQVKQIVNTINNALTSITSLNTIITNNDDKVNEKFKWIISTNTSSTPPIIPGPAPVIINTSTFTVRATTSAGFCDRIFTIDVIQ